MMPRWQGDGGDGARKRAWTLPGPGKPVRDYWGGAGDASAALPEASPSPAPAAPAAATAAATPTDSLLGGMRPAVNVAQIFCLIPVRKPIDAAQVDFRWKSPRTGFILIVIVLTVWKSSYSFIRMLEKGIKYNTSVNAVFFTMTISAQLMFLRLGAGWPALVRAAAPVEAAFRRAYGPPRRLRARMHLVTAVGLAMAFVEHSMSIAGIIDFVWPCYQKGGLGLLIQGYCITKYRKTFTSMSFNGWSASLVLGLQIINQFVWSYLDLFVALVAMGLSALFQQINTSIDATLVNGQTSQYWKARRGHYTALTELVRQADGLVGPIILVTYASDLYFICLQTLAIVNPVNVSKYTRAYFIFSLIYIITRTTFMTYVASNLNEESKRPKDALFELRSTAYSFEAERFLKQIVSDDVALTGCNFFTITRSFLLTVAGTIVTYVVVLVQFNKGKSEDHPAVVVVNSTVSCTCEDLKNALIVSSCP